MDVRKAMFAGSWYPASPTACEKEIKNFLQDPNIKIPSRKNLVGGIVPHAGWFYSGAVAAKVIQTISKQQNIPLTELKEIISRAYWNHAISIEFAPSANDILSLTDRALSILLRKSNPLNISRETLRIISELNGRTPLSTILTAIHFDNKTRAISDLAKLLTRGYIQRISVESKLVLVNECILKELFHIVLGDYKNEEMRELLSTFIDEGISKFPWLSRIKVSKDLEVRTQLEDGMAPSDLDQVYEALEYLIRRVETSISGVRDARFASNLREKAQKKCNETWFSAFQDSIF